MNKPGQKQRTIKDLKQENKEQAERINKLEGFNLGLATENVEQAKQIENLEGMLTVAGLEFADQQGKMNELKAHVDALLGFHNPWDLINVLTKLLEAADLLLQGYSYDGHGYELLNAAQDQAIKYQSIIRETPAQSLEHIKAEARNEVLDEVIDICRKLFAPHTLQFDAVMMIKDKCLEIKTDNKANDKHKV